MFYLALSAIFGILAFLPFNFFWIFGFIFLVPFFVFCVQENKFWKLIAGSFIFKLIFISGTVYFTFEPITWLSVILIFLGLPISIFAAKKITTANYLPILLPFLWTFFDHLGARFSLSPTYIITAGNAFGSSPFSGLAAMGGLPLLTFFSATINILIALTMLKIKKINQKSLIFILLFAILLITAAWQISEFYLRKNSANYQNSTNSLKIAVVSANEKFNFSQFNSIKNELSNKQIDLLILPEDLFNNNDENFNYANFTNLAKKLNVAAIASFDTFQNGKKYNSSVFIDKKGNIIDIYEKNRLTFIGEYWPFGSWRPFYFDWAGKTDPEFKNYAVLDYQKNYSRGNKKIINFNINSAPIKIAPLICLEIHYPEDLKTRKKMGVNFFINPSSNRWLDIGVEHYLYLTGNLRNIESIWLKTPIIFNGIKEKAGIIFPDGKSQFINFENQFKNYGIFIGEIKF